MHDTSPEVMAKMSKMIQRKTPIERLQMGVSMYQTSKYLIIRAIKEKNPDISEVDLRKALFIHFYGDDFNPIQREKILSHLEKAK